MARAMVSASTGAMNSVLAKLTALLDDEYKFLKSTKIEIRFLRDELTSMKGLLDKLANNEDLDPLVKGWMKQVREMTYDLEYCIDNFMGRLGDANVAKPGRLFQKSLRKIEMIKSRHMIARDLQELKARIVEASERCSRYKLDDAGNQMKLSSPSMSSNFVPIDPRLHADGDSLVGIDGPREELIQRLAPDAQQQLKVVSILGVGGLGKTTLAREVDRGLRGRFDHHIFVSVSRRPDVRMILRSILSQVGAQDYTSTECDERKLIDELRELLQDKRYFVIIDDLWDVQAWQVIRLALPENQRGSRILVTTRINNVAMSCCYSAEHILHMLPLTAAESKKLFFRRIFHPECCCPPHLQEISAEILKKCGGLPLAIIAIASMLANKSAEEEWKIARRPLFGYDDNLDGLPRILNCCYLDLPIHLKTCLLYLSVFPENYVLDRARLIRRWVAEGFVEAHGMSLEEVGESYFNELINRCLVQSVGIQYNGRIEACRVHDIILDFIKSKSADENFVTTYDGWDQNVQLQDKVRRLSLDFGHAEGGNFIPLARNNYHDYSHVRSLTIFMSNKEIPRLAIFRALRVLDLESSGNSIEYLRNIGELYLLRYLRLETKSSIELPEQIGELQYLETLDLTHALIRRRLPRSIVRLKQLTYLLVRNVKLLDGIGVLQALQELSHVKVESSNPASSLEELGRLTMLRVLGLNWCISDTDTDTEKCAESLVSSINKLGTSNLQSLHIRSGSGCSLDFLLDSLSAPFYRLQEFQMTSDYYFPRIPKWVASLVSLTLLQINIDIVGEEVLRILGKLPSLLVLLLSGKKSAGPEQGLIIRSSGFQCLKEFDFFCSNSLAMLMFEPGTMPKLEKLQSGFRAKEACLDNGLFCGIEHLASLKHLHVGIYCDGAETPEVAAVEDAIKSVVSAHPNRPKLELRRWGMVEIPVHGEEEEGHKDEEDIDVVEEEPKPTTES